MAESKINSVVARDHMQQNLKLESSHFVDLLKHGLDLIITQAMYQLIK